MADLEKIGFLKQYFSLGIAVDQLVNERQAWVELAGKIAPCQWDSGESGGRIRVVQGQLSEVGKQLTDEIGRLVALRGEIGQAISRVSDPRCRQVLLRRYLQGQKWEEIADGMGYSRMQIQRLHEKGVADMKCDGMLHGEIDS